MTNPFYESEVVRGEVQEMEKLYLELAKLSVKFTELDDAGRREHLEGTLELIAKQKVFYARLALMAHQDKEAADIKFKIDTLSEMYSGGKHINEVLDDFGKMFVLWKLPACWLRTFC